MEISHENPKAETRVGNYLEDIYGRITIRRGKLNEYLGMTFDFSNPGEVMVSMLWYVQDMIKNFPEVLGAAAATPAAKHLFKVSDADAVKPLPEDQRSRP